jgi:ankyrin repeat protein
MATHLSRDALERIYALSPEPQTIVDAGEVSLFGAAISGKRDIETWLLSHGVDPNSIYHLPERSPSKWGMQFSHGPKGEAYPYSLEGMTPLMAAAANAHAEVAGDLLEHGARVDLQTEEGNTALMFAAQKGSVEIVRRLLAAGARPSDVNAHGASALQLAREAGAVDVVDVLTHPAEQMAPVPPAAPQPTAGQRGSSSRPHAAFAAPFTP